MGHDEKYPETTAQEAKQFIFTAIDPEGPLFYTPDLAVNGDTLAGSFPGFVQSGV
jgi:hypothetical protein